MTKCRLWQRFLAFFKDRPQFRAQCEHVVPCKKSCKISLINFRRYLLCLQNLIAEFFDLAADFYIVQAQICTRTSQLSASSANSILITQPTNNEVLNALDTIRRCLQCEGADMDTLFCLEKKLQESMQNNINQSIIAWNFTCLEQCCV